MRWWPWGANGESILVDQRFFMVAALSVSVQSATATLYATFPLLWLAPTLHSALGAFILLFHLKHYRVYLSLAAFLCGHGRISQQLICKFTKGFLSKRFDMKPWQHLAFTRHLHIATEPTQSFISCECIKDTSCKIVLLFSPTADVITYYLFALNAFRS